MSPTEELRQHASSHNESERLIRENDTRQLVHDVIGRNEVYFADPNNRLAFIGSHSASEIFPMVQYVNAKLRGENPHQIRASGGEKGAFLPGLHTPSHEDKPKAFESGYRAIREYIQESDDPVDKKVQGVAMAMEALVIWVHPFNDGNGRTSRFLGSLIENGAGDVDALVAGTVSAKVRRTNYSNKLPTREGVLIDANNDDLMYDDDERAELRERAETLPSDVDGMYMSVKRLLENEEVRSHARRYEQRFERAA